MALFDVFKKKQPTHDEKLSLAYRAYKQDMVEMIFPGKKPQADCVVRSLALLTSTNLNLCDAKDYFDILSIFSGVLIRCVVTHSEDSHIVAMLQQKHGNYVKTKSVAQKVLTYCKMNMNNNSFVLNSKEDFEALDILAALFASNEDVAKGNEAAQTINLEDPQYGLIPEKPIYTKGVAGSEQYLGKLRTESGERITWKRRGSTVASGVKGMVDIYNCFDPSGKDCGTIYINMYGTKNSSTAPAGLIMEGEEPKKEAASTPSKRDIKKEAEQQAGKDPVESAEAVKAAKVKEQHPEFDLETENKNRLFSAMISCDIDMQDAYEVIHKDDLLTCVVPVGSEGEVLTAQQAEKILEKIAPIIEWTPRTAAEIEGQAVKYGMTISQAIEVDKKDSECAQLKRKMQQQSHRKWAAEAVNVQKVYSSFDLELEMQNSKFKQLLSGEVPMLVAYEVIHRAELFALKEVTAEPKRPMFCRKCGAKLLSDSVFCMRCGTKV